MSNSRDGKILLNILKSLPKRGIWMIRQEGAWTTEKGRECGVRHGWRFRVTDKHNRSVKYKHQHNQQLYSSSPDQSPFYPSALSRLHVMSFQTVCVVGLLDQVLSPLLDQLCVYKHWDWMHSSRNRFPTDPQTVVLSIQPCVWRTIARHEILHRATVLL